MIAGTALRLFQPALLRSDRMATKRHKNHKNSFPFCGSCAFLWQPLPDSGQGSKVGTDKSPGNG